MCTFRVALVLIAAALARASGHAQTPAAEPVFDVVSIKPHVVSGTEVAAFTMMNQRPDGGLTMSRVPVGLILAMAYQPMSTADMVGLPDWAQREFYDISATASLKDPSLETRMQMVRAMLADRFRLQAHRERREVPSFDLVLARDDGKLGPALVRSANDCDALIAARRKEAAAAARAGGPPPPPQRFDPNAPPPCTFGGIPNGVFGELTIPNLAAMLRNAAGRIVVDKTGLTGWYRATLKFDFAAYPELARTAPADDPPSVFTALREQLGLKLEPSRTERDVLVIDRLERPTEN
jgi:uncharacterized protein (TIGR03435 family)